MSIDTILSLCEGSTPLKSKVLLVFRSLLALIGSLKVGEGGYLRKKGLQFQFQLLRK